ARLAAALLRLAERDGERTERGRALPFHLTRQSLADLCGTTVETAIRVMSRWTRDGVVREEGGHLIVPRLERLRSISSSEAEPRVPPPSHRLGYTPSSRLPPRRPPGSPPRGPGPRIGPPAPRLDDSPYDGRHMRQHHSMTKVAKRQGARHGTASRHIGCSDTVAIGGLIAERLTWQTRREEASS